MKWVNVSLYKKNESIFSILICNTLDRQVGNRVFFSFLRFRERKAELHTNLKEALIRGFLNYKFSGHNKNISRWKAQMRRFCDSSQHDGSPILTDFVCLEQKGQLAPGKYDELAAMFQNVDIRAVDVIRNTSASFVEIEKERIGITIACKYHQIMYARCEMKNN